MWERLNRRFSLPHYCQIPHFPFEGGKLCDAFKTADFLGSCPKNKLDDFFDVNKLNEETFFEKLLKVEENLIKKKQDINKSQVDDLGEIWTTPLEDDESILDAFTSRIYATGDSIQYHDNQRDPYVADVNMLCTGWPMVQLVKKGFQFFKIHFLLHLKVAKTFIFLNVRVV